MRLLIRFTLLTTSQLCISLGYTKLSQQCGTIINVQDTDISEADHRICPNLTR